MGWANAVIVLLLPERLSHNFLELSSVCRPTSAPFYACSLRTADLRRPPAPAPAPASMLAWRPNGIGCVWRHVAGQHVRQGLLGERRPETHHQPARRGRAVFRDQDRVVGQKHFILASELLRPGAAVQKAAGVLPWGPQSPVQVSPDRRLVCSLTHSHKHVYCFIRVFWGE